MNYGLALSLAAERHLAELQAQERERAPRASESAGHGVQEEQRYGMQYQQHDGEDQGDVRAEGGADEKADEWEDIEEKALQGAIDEVYAASGHRFRPWAANGRACRVGEIILLVDSDTVVPEVRVRCGVVSAWLTVGSLRRTACGMRRVRWSSARTSPLFSTGRVSDLSPGGGAVLTRSYHSHAIDVMQVAHHYFENGIAYFTRRINRCISFSMSSSSCGRLITYSRPLSLRKR